MSGGGNAKIIIDMRAIASEGQACADIAPWMEKSLEELLHPSLPGVKAADWSDVAPICDAACAFADTMASGRENIRYMIRDASVKYAGIKA